MSNRMWWSFVWVLALMFGLGESMRDRRNGTRYA